MKIGSYKEPRRIQALPVAPAAPLAGRGVHTYICMKYLESAGALLGGAVIANHYHRAGPINTLLISTRLLQQATHAILAHRYGEPRGRLVSVVLMFPAAKTLKASSIRFLRFCIQYSSLGKFYPRFPYPALIAPP